MVKGKKKGTRLNIDNYGIKIIVSFMLVILIFSTFAYVKIINDSNKFGYVYYGHLQPNKIEIPGGISDKETSAIVYKYVEKEPVKKLEERLVKGSGFKGKFIKDDDCLQLKVGKTERIFIYDHNKWAVYYNYSQNGGTDISKLPKEREAINLSLKSLQKFGIYKDTIKFKEISKDYGDKNLRMVFSSKNTSDKNFVFGDIVVTLGENGKLLGIDDNRVNCKFYEKVKTISPKQSITVSRDVGVGKWNGAAYVKTVKHDFYFNKDTGFLIPTWKIEAFFKSKNSNNKLPWEPNVDAIR